MHTMTLEELLMKEDDSVVLGIYNELESLVVPSTGYAHAYCRKVNKLINAGQLCVLPGKYRNVYLPTLSKMIFKEMSRRYAQVLYREKTIAQSELDELGIVVDKHPNVIDAKDVEIEGINGIDEPRVCVWCCNVFDRSEVHMTDIGLLCDTCITAIRSRGEEVSVYD